MLYWHPDENGYIGCYKKPTNENQMETMHIHHLSSILPPFLSMHFIFYTYYITTKLIDFNKWGTIRKKLTAITLIISCHMLASHKWCFLFCKILQFKPMLFKTQYWIQCDSRMCHFHLRKYLLTFNMWGPSHLGSTMSISWLLMPWLLASPGHQQP